MTNLQIPRLKDLVWRQTRFAVSRSVAMSFVEIHSIDGSSDESWRTAQEHWERIVYEVLDSDAVAQNAHGQDAVRQAVTATAEMLNTIGSHACPICSILALDARPQDDEKSA